jgi:tryptophan synthase beta chain
MTGVEAGGTAIQPGQHAARFAGGQCGVLQGTKTVLLQDNFGQIQNTHSISAGLDYPAVGPEHAFLNSIERVQYSYVHDNEALQAGYLLAQQEGIIPALESAHAIAHAIKIAPQSPRDHILLVGLSGRGDKDVETYTQYLESQS